MSVFDYACGDGFIYQSLKLCLCVTATYDGIAIKGYFDGEFYAQTALTGLNEATTEEMYIEGCRRATLHFNDTVDEVRICNRILSPAEIQENFQKGPDFSSKLLAKIPKDTTQIFQVVRSNFL